MQNPRSPASAEAFCKNESIVMSVPPEKMNLKLQLFLGLRDHMTEQQDKNVTSIKIVGIDTALL